MKDRRGKKKYPAITSQGAIKCWKPCPMNIFLNLG